MGIYQQYKAGTLDLISSDFTRPEENASEMRNVLFTGSVEDPAIEKRFGLKRRAADGPIHGAVEFERLRPLDLNKEKELLGFFANGLKRRREATLTVTYAGAAAAATLTLWYDPATSDFRCLIVEDGVTTYNGDLGIGYEEVSPVTISDLDTAISALTGFTATVSGTATIPAAMLNNIYQHDLIGGPAELLAYDWEDVGEAGGFYPGPGNWNILESWLDQPEYEPISNTSLNSCLYFYYDGTLMKYDGQNYYPSGCAQPTGISTVAAVSGSIPAGTYQYKARVKHRDSVGNIIYGPWSETSSITLVATRDVNVGVTASDPTSTKSTRCNLTMGAAGVIISVSNDVFEENDTIAVWDRATSAIVYSRVTSVAVGSIIIDTSVQLTSGDAITLGTTVEVVRTKVGGTLFYYNLERPIDWLNPAPAYLDATLDAALIEEVIESEFDFGPAPSGKYVAKYQGGLVVSGFPLSRLNRAARSGIYNQVTTLDYGIENEVAFADYENYEGFPIDGSFNVSVESDEGDTVRGLIESGNSLIVFKDRTIARLSGDPTELDIRLDWMSKEVGCLAGHTIKEINGQVMFLSTRGFAVVTESMAPTEKPGIVIRPIIENGNLPEIQKLKFLCGHTCLLSSRQLYLSYLPAYAAESSRPVERVTIGPNLGDGQPNYVDVPIPFESGFGRLFAYDYLRGRWSEWQFNALGALAEYDGNLVASDRRLSALTSDVESGLFLENVGNTGIMYQDHEAAISWRFGTAWYHGGKPSVPKQISRIRVSSVPRTENNAPTMDVRQQVNYRRTDLCEVELPFGLQTAPYQVVAQSRLADGKYNSTRIILENEEHNTNVEVEGWELEVDAPYISELKT